MSCFNNNVQTLLDDCVLSLSQYKIVVQDRYHVQYVGVQYVVQDRYHVQYVGHVFHVGNLHMSLRNTRLGQFYVMCKT